MIFKETPLSGACLIEPEAQQDERGFFARSFCVEEFERHGLNPRVVQCNISYNREKGTLRGMHYQVGPAAEAKLVRCTQGTIYDVIVDLRPGSDSFMKWFGTELNGEKHYMLYIPEHFAHGYISLTDETEVFYQMSEFYAPECARGFRWDDPSFQIYWPITVEVISEKDRHWPDFEAPPFGSSPAATSF